MHTTRVKSERLPRILLMQPLGPDFLVRRTMYQLAQHTLRCEELFLSAVSWYLWQRWLVVLAVALVNTC